MLLELLKGMWWLVNKTGTLVATIAVIYIVFNAVLVAEGLHVASIETKDVMAIAYAKAGELYNQGTALAAWAGDHMPNRLSIPIDVTVRHIDGFADENETEDEWLDEEESLTSD